MIAPAPDKAVVSGRYLGFRLDGETYGLDIRVVQEIVSLLPATRVPGAPAHVRGVVNLRGRVVPVVDLRTLFGMAAAPDTGRTCLVICRQESDAEAGVAALVVDDMTEVMNVAAGAGLPPACGAANPYVAGLAQTGGRVVVLLDAAKLFGGVDEPGGAA